MGPSTAEGPSASAPRPVASSLGRQSGGASPFPWFVGTGWTLAGSETLDDLPAPPFPSVSSFFKRRPSPHPDPPSRLADRGPSPPPGPGRRDRARAGGREGGPNKCKDLTENLGPDSGRGPEEAAEAPSEGTFRRPRVTGPSAGGERARGWRGPAPRTGGVARDRGGPAEGPVYRGRSPAARGRRARDLRLRREG